jgi:hypothetical protein
LLSSVVIGPCGEALQAYVPISVNVTAALPLNPVVVSSLSAADHRLALNGGRKLDREVAAICRTSIEKVLAAL